MIPSKFLGCTIFPYTFPWLTQNSFGFSFISQLQLFHPWYLPSSGPLLWTRARRRPGWKEVRKQFKYLMSKSEPWVSHSYFSVAVHCSWLAHNVGTVDHHIILKLKLWSQNLPADDLVEADAWGLPSYLDLGRYFFIRFFKEFGVHLIRKWIREHKCWRQEKIK